MKKIDNHLPVTRKALFFDVLRNRWRLLILCGLLLGLFFLPIAVSSFFNDYFLSNLALNEAYFVDGSFTEDGQALYQSLETIFTFINIALVFVFGVGLSGIKKIFIKLSWSEGVLFWSDFKKGIKENYKEDLLNYIVFSMIYFLYQFFVVMMNNLTLVLILIIVANILFFPLIIVGFSYHGIYVNPILKRVKNSSILYVKNAPICILLSVIFSAFFLLSMIPYTLMIIKQIIFLIAVVFLLPLLLLLITIVSAYIFDKDINKNIHPEIYRKGLY